MSVSSVCCEILQQQKCFRRAFTALHGENGLKTNILWLPAVLMVLEYICHDLGRTKSIYLEVRVGDDNEHGPTAGSEDGRESLHRGGAGHDQSKAG